MVPVIIDAVLLLILVICIIHGARRGLILSITGLLTMFIAVGGAYYLAKAVSPTASTWIQPKIQASLEEQYKQSASKSSANDSAGTSAGKPAAKTDANDSEVVSVLKKMGLYDSVANYISGAVTKRANAAGVAASTALAETLSRAVAFWAVFAISFFLILILLAIVSRALNLIAHLPGLHFLNRLGGALFGFIKGLLILFLIAWATRFLGSVLPEETVSKTYFLRILIETNPVNFLPTL